MKQEWSTLHQLNDGALQDSFRLKYGVDPDGIVSGWGPLLRKRFSYYTPDDVYEALVDELVASTSTWLDIGCGRHLFPSNIPLAKELSKRANVLVGIDPDPNVHDNPFVHSAVQESIQDYQTQETFDLITMRMVAEHVAEPDSLFSKLTSISKSGSQLVIYTPWKWSPIPIITRITPFRLHHLPKKIFWNVEERDTFPVAYKMNTRRELCLLAESHNWREESFALIDDCRTTSRWRLPQWVELIMRKMLRGLGLPYPERCIVATYRRI